MSVLGDVVTIGGGGSYASIWLTGAVQSTDIVTATKGSKTVNGVWTTISGVNGFLCDKIDEFGTWTVTASRSGTAYYTQDVLVDAAERFDLTYSSRLYLYNEGDECTSITGGWKATGIGSTSYWTCTKNDSNIYMKNQNINDYQPYIATNSKINVASYTKLKVLLDLYRYTTLTTASVAYFTQEWKSTNTRTSYYFGNNSQYTDKNTHYNNVTASWDLNEENNYLLFGCSMGHANGYCEATIYKIWLE